MGGYQLLCLLLFLHVSNFLIRYKHLKNVFFKTNVLLIISLTIFFGRNIDRLINENTKYGFNPFVNPVYRITDDHFLIQNRFREIVKDRLFCETNHNKCANNIDVKLKYGYKIFFKK